MSQRPIYLVVYKSPVFAAHWALWIPSYDAAANSPGDIGKLINVNGDSSSGFQHEFVRNHNMAQTRRSKTVILLGMTNSDNVVDQPSSGDEATDAVATDVIEEWALSVPAPGPSLRSAASEDRRIRITLQNCQTWLRQLVQALVENGVFGTEALDEVDRAPKN